MMKVVIKNSRDNTPIDGAKVSLLIDLSSGRKAIFSDTVGKNGTLTMKIPSNGNYTVKVEKDGFITVNEHQTINVDMGNCEVEAPIVFIPINPDITCEGGVRVSLTWNKKASDLDLYSFKVGNQDPWNRCLTYFCDGKLECGCAKFDTDNHAGALNGSETISYCCNNIDASHTLFVDDFS